MNARIKKLNLTLSTQIKSERISELDRLPFLLHRIEKQKISPPFVKEIFPSILSQQID